MNEFSLYNIANGFVALMNQDEITEIDVEKIENELTQLLETKSQSIVGYDRQIEANIEALKAEEERLHELRKRLEKKRESFYDYIKTCLEKMSKDKVETTIGTIRLKKCPASVEVTHEDLIPSEFKRIKQTEEVNKALILQNFKETGEVPVGTNIVTNKTKVEIK